MALVFGSPEAAAILAKDKALRDGEARVEAIASGPYGKLTEEEREKFRDIAFEIILRGFEDEATAEAEALSDADLVDMVAEEGNKDALLIQEERFS